MVLNDLGRRINDALSSLSGTSIISEEGLDKLLKSVCSALLESDVNVLLVKQLRDRVKTRALPQLTELQTKSKDTEAVTSQKGRQIVNRVLFDELVKLVNPGADAPPAFNPRKGRPSVIMMVGLQGAGKTTTCTKLATYYSRRGFKTALVCADTFRAGAFDQLKQNATKARVPFFGSYTETDPVQIAAQGVEKFRKDRFEVIILDTSGRHRQEAELFEEMVEISRAVEPDSTILVLDGAIGQAAEAQSKAFKEASNFGAIIVTKLDGHAKGGGAISAVAATKTPIAFIGTGEHITDLERFNPQPFISKMLGLGDMQGLMEHAQTVAATADPEKQQKMREKIQRGEFTLRDFKEQMSSVMNMGPLSKMASMIPGMGQMMGQGGDEEAAKKMKRMMFIFDSMTNEELDSDGSIFRSASTSSQPTAAGNKGKSKQLATTTPAPKDEALTDEMTPREPNKRVLRVARGSGTNVNEVEEVLAQHLMFSKMVKKAGGKAGWMSKMQQGGAGGRMPAGMPPGMMGPGGMPDLSKLTPGQLSAMKNMMPPHMRDQLSRPGAMEQLQQMMQGMGGAGGMGGLASMMGMGAGGGIR